MQTLEFDVVRLMVGLLLRCSGDKLQVVTELCSGDKLQVVTGCYGVQVTSCRW